MVLSDLILGLAWAASLGGCAVSGILFLVFKVTGDEEKSVRALSYLKKAALAAAIVLAAAIAGRLVLSLVSALFLSPRSGYVDGAGYGVRA